jgi:tetratricopeptide (TPR) repeat protein
VSDRFRDAFVIGLLLTLALALGDVTLREGRVALGLAALVAAAVAASARRAAAPGPLPRTGFLAAVLFLAVQPFAIDPADAAPVPARALLVLAAALALWAHLNVQSVSGRLAWKFSTLDAGVISACVFVLAASLGLLWVRADVALVVPQILLQGAAVGCGVLYLYLTRWRPDRPAFVAAGTVLAALLVASFALAEVRGRALAAERSRLDSAWAARSPEPGEVEAAVAAARRASPDQVGDLLAAAGRAALAGGRPAAAAEWIERARGAAPEAMLPWIATAELAASERDELLRLEAIARAAELAGGPPPGLPLPAETARDLALDLLDRGRPAAAVAWLDAAGGPRRDLALLRAEAALALGEASDGRRRFGELLRSRPDDLEALLGVARARLGTGDKDGALAALERARGLGAPAALIVPLLAALGPPEDPQADRDRAALREGLVVVDRDGWPDRHPNGNFLTGSREDRRLPLLLAPGRDYEIEIEARGEPARGESPILRVEADGRNLADVTAGEAWARYRLRLTPPRSAVTLRITFPNDWFEPGGEDRNLVVGEVRLRSLPASSAILGRP